MPGRTYTLAMEPSTQADIVIAGGGPIAQTLALALTRMLPDLSVVMLARPVIQQAPDIRAFAVSAGSANLFRALDLWTAIEPAAEPVQRIDIADASLNNPARRTALSYDNMLERGDPASSILPSDALRGVLAQAVAATPAIGVIPSSAATQNADAHGITIMTADGHSVRARLAVAADGRHSPLRDAAGIRLVGWDYPQTAIVTRVRHERAHEGVARQHFLPAGPFAILPLRGGHHSSIVWSEATTEAQRILALPEADALIELERRFGGLLGSVTLDAPLQPWPLKMHLVRTFIAPRLAIAGDAARAVHPIAGQGLNLGLRDVAALTEVVAGAIRLGLDFGSGQTLEHYERWRRFDSVQSSATMDGLNRVFGGDNAVIRALRTAGVGLVDRLPQVKTMLVNEAAGISGKVPRLLRGMSV
jgi:2-octaprenyl-6-methoxyphenol hydroxylase